MMVKSTLKSKSVSFLLWVTLNYRGKKQRNNKRKWWCDDYMKMTFWTSSSLVLSFLSALHIQTSFFILSSAHFPLQVKFFIQQKSWAKNFLWRWKKERKKKHIIDMESHLITSPPKATFTPSLLLLQNTVPASWRNILSTGDPTFKCVIVKQAKFNFIHCRNIVPLPSLWMGLPCIGRSERQSLSLSASPPRNWCTLNHAPQSIFYPHSLLFSHFSP